MKKVGIFSALVLVAGAFTRCVGDSTVVTDAGNDVTSQNDGSSNDASDAALDVKGEAEAAPPPDPTPDGSIVWFNHYNTNSQIYDLSATDPAGNLVVVGGLFTCSGSGCTSSSPDYQTHIGGFSLPSSPPSVRTDALIAKLGPGGSPIWARSMTALPSDASFFANDDNLTAVGIDSAGDIYVAGYTASASITLKDTLPGPCAFVAKLSSDGTSYSWDKAYTATTYVGSPFVSVVGSKVAVALSYKGTLSFDSGQSVMSAGVDVFVAELNTADGTTVWHQSIGGSSDEYVNDVIQTPTNDAIIGGVTYSPTVAGTGTGFPLASVGTKGNGFIAKLGSANGSAAYTLGYGDSASVGDTAINAVGYGNGIVAIGGQTYGTSVDFGKGGTSSTNGDGFLLAYDETKKSAVFVTPLASDQFDAFQGVAIDFWGNIFATGVYASYGSTTAKLGSQTLPNSSFRTQGMLLAKWDPAGNLLWVDPYVPTPYATQDGGASYLWYSGARVRVSSSGGAYVVGGMTGSGPFGSTGNQQHLSTLGCLGLCLCFTPPCAAPIQPDGLVGAWLP